MNTKVQKYNLGKYSGQLCGPSQYSGQSGGQSVGHTGLPQYVPTLGGLRYCRRPEGVKVNS